MKVRVFLFSCFTIAMLALATLLTIITNTTPTTREVLVVFYSSLFVVLGSLFFGAGYGFIVYKTRLLPSWHQTTTTARLSLIIAAILTLSLALKASSLWSMGWLAILIVAGGLVELALRKRSFQTKQGKAVKVF